MGCWCCMNRCPLPTEKLPMDIPTLLLSDVVGGVVYDVCGAWCGMWCGVGFV